MKSSQVHRYWYSSPVVRTTETVEEWKVGSTRGIVVVSGQGGRKVGCGTVDGERKGGERVYSRVGQG